MTTDKDTTGTHPENVSKESTDKDKAFEAWWKSEDEVAYFLLSKMNSARRGWDAHAAAIANGPQTAQSAQGDDTFARELMCAAIEAAGYKRGYEAHAALTKDELEEWEQSFALFDRATRSLRAYWHKHNPQAEPGVYPDTARLCEWIVGELERVKDVIEAARKWKDNRGKIPFESLEGLDALASALDRLAEQDKGNG